MTQEELYNSRERIIKGCKFIMAFMTDANKWESHTGQLAIKKLRDLLSDELQVETVEVEEMSDLVALQEKINAQ